MQIFYYDSKGKKYKGKIRVCDICGREDLVTIYNLKTRCKFCSSKTRKDSIGNDEFFLSQKNGKYKIRAVKIICEKCGNSSISRRNYIRKTNLCQKCAVSEIRTKELTGQFGKLNRNYKNGLGIYRRVGRSKNEGKCSICGSIKKIHIHHIDKNRKNNMEENLIPLCSFCHLSLHAQLKKGLSHEEAFSFVSRKKSINVS